MVFLFAGDDIERKISAYENFLNEIPKGTEIFSFNKSDFDAMQVESLYSGSGLFFSEHVVVFSNVFESKDAKEFLLEKLQILGESSNKFIFLEGKLTKKEQDAFKKARAEVNYFELPKHKKEKFNNFLLANDLGAGNKFLLWLHFRQAMERGVSLEELVGVLFWKAKDMLLKRDFKKVSEKTLKNIAQRLAYLLPEARAKRVDDEAEVERFLLEAF